MQEQNHHVWVIGLTIVIAFVLTIIPMPDWARDWRPEWVAMVMIYWSMALPQRVGLGVAWLTGLLLDVLQGALFGQHALGLVVVVYIVLNSYQRIRVFPLFQQAIMVFFMMIIYMLLAFWVKGITGHPPWGFSYWLPAVSSMLLWPWTFVLLRDLRRRMAVS